MDDTYLNPGDKQIALYVIKALIEFFDGTREVYPTVPLDIGRKLLERHHILTEDEYKER